MNFVNYRLNLCMHVFYFFLIYLLFVIIFFRIVPSLIQSSVPIESQRTQRTAALATHSVPNRRTLACITLLKNVEAQRQNQLLVYYLFIYLLPIHSTTLQGNKLTLLRRRQPKAQMRHTRDVPEWMEKNGNFFSYLLIKKALSAHQLQPGEFPLTLPL